MSANSSTVKEEMNKLTAKTSAQSSSSVASGVFPSSTTITQKTSSENELILQLKKRVEALEALMSSKTSQEVTISSKVNWDHQMVNKGIVTLDQRAYPLTLYKTKVTKGTLAISIENGRTSKPGTLKIGVRVDKDSTEILTLARVHKTVGHDFFLRKAVLVNEPSIEYGVVTTPQNYDANPNQLLGYPGVSAPIINVNCDENDEWVQPHENLMDRSHSPTF